MEAIGDQAVADWAAFIKRDLDGIVSVRAIKVVAERCPGLSRGLQCARLRLVRLTLTAHGHLYECLACAFQDGWPFRQRFIAAQDDLDVKWIELETAAMPAGLFAGDECRSRTEEGVDDDVAGSVISSSASSNIATGLTVGWYCRRLRASDLRLKAPG